MEQPEMIYILGAGAVAKVTLNYYKDCGRFNEVTAFIEENCKRTDQEIYGKSISDASIVKDLSKDSKFIGAIGSPKRKRWIKEIELMGFDFDILVHPSVIIGMNTTIGKGCIISPGVVLACDTKIGLHSLIGISSTITHDCTIGDFVTICPDVAIGGNVIINDECWIGIGAKIINEVTIGRGAYIGAGAVVTDDIPDNFLAVGVPAKPIRELTESDWRELI